MKHQNDIREHFVCSIVIVVVSQEARARGENISKHCRRKAVVASDSTCRSQSTVPQKLVACYGEEWRTAKLTTNGRKYV